MKLKISKPSYLAAASLCITKEKSRPYLAGVRIEPVSDTESGIFLVATDGKRMAVFRDENGSASEPVTLRVTRNLFNVCRHQSYKHTEYKGDNFRLVRNETTGLLEAQTPTYYDDGTETDLPTVHHVERWDSLGNDFAPWRRIVPANLEGETGKGENPPRLQLPHSVAQVAGFERIFNAAFGTSKHNPNLIRIVDRADGKSSVLLSDYPDFLGVLMPFRSSGRTAGWNMDKMPFEVPQI